MIKVLCVGKVKERYLSDMIKDYYTRVKKYHKIEIIEVKDTNIDDEKDEILKYLRKDDYIISMAIEGEKCDSIGFKNIIQNLFINGVSDITFIIGGSEGIHDKIKRLSNELLSFSDLTFPHALFRGMLLEQIYRTFKIINFERYHK